MKNYELIEILMQQPAGSDVMLVVNPCTEVLLSHVNTDIDMITLVPEQTPEVVDKVGEIVGTIDDLLNK